MIEIDNDEDREQHNNIYKKQNIQTYSLISCDSEGNEKVKIQESKDTIYHVLTSNKKPN